MSATQCRKCQASLDTLDAMMRELCGPCRLEDAPQPLNLFENLEDGRHCPCCGQWVKAYKRRLRANHVRFLRQLAERGTSVDPWVHYKTLRFAGRDYNYLAHFGLAEARAGGFWRPTPKGYSFLAGSCAVPEWILVFDNQVMGASTHEVTVSQCEAGGEFTRADLT